MSTGINFVEVETRETADADPADSTFCFKCVECHSVALATNGSMVLRDPMEPMSDQKQYFVDYLYCWKCKILENMKDKEFNKQVVIISATQPPKDAKNEFTRKIIEDIFS